MHFHLPNHRSFLRVHQPKKYGDNLKVVRPLMADAILHKKVKCGFEMGIYDKNRLTYRVAIPIFKDKVFLGVLEFGIDLHYIVVKLESFIKNVYDSEISVEFLLKYHKKSEDENVSFFGPYLYEFDQVIWRTLRPKLLYEKNEQMLQMGESTYKVSWNTMMLNNSRGQTVGTVLYAVDITPLITEYKEVMLQAILKPLIVILVVWLLIQQLFNLFIFRLEAVYGRAQRIIDTQKSIVIISNGVGLKEANQAFFTFFGYKSVEAFSREHSCICDFFVDEKGCLQRYMEKESWLDYILSHAQEKPKVKMKNREGDIYTFQIELNLFELTDGEKEYTISFNDITLMEESSATQQLLNRELARKSKSQSELLTLFNLGDIVLFKWKNDEKWSIEYVSSNVHKIFGFSREAFLNGNVEYGYLLYFEDKERIAQEIEEAKRTHKDYFEHKPYRIITHDGRMKWVLDHTALLRDESGEVTHFLGYIVDISDVKHQEEMFKSNKERLQLAIEGSNDGLWDWNLQKDDIYFSPRWKGMIGFEDYEIPHAIDEWISRIHPNDVQKMQKDLENHLKGKTDVFENGHRMLTREGNYIWFLSKGKALFNEQGGALRMVGFHTDISKQKAYENDLKHLINEKVIEIRQKEEILQQQSKLAAMGEMIGAIAHQWRQPLNALNINIENLEEDFEEGEIDRDYLDKFIEKQTGLIHFMSSTIDDFRSFFRIDKNREPFHVLETVKKAVAILHAELKSHLIEVEFLYENDAVIEGFKSEFQQVILNLIANAKDAIVEAGKKEGKITITLSSLEDTVTLHIEDNAGGVSEEITDRIFEPYFTTKEEGKGTGIGLYLAKMIIEENMGGTISMQNGEKGAIFILRFDTFKTPKS